MLCYVTLHFFYDGRNLRSKHKTPFDTSQFNKEISNGRWRAYSKGTVELCEKYSAFAMNGRATLTEAPKDVRRLEALRPVNVPSMGERYETAVSREKRLEAATLLATPKPDGPKKGDGPKEGGSSIKDGGKYNQKRKGGRDGERDGDSNLEEEETKQQARPTKKKKKKKAKVVNEAHLMNVEALEEEDEVQEGVVWSDSD